MSQGRHVHRLSDMLLDGPRGRRLLLEYALHAELSISPMRDSDSLGYAVVTASSRISQRRGGVVRFGGRDRSRSEATVIEIAERLSALKLPKPTPERVRDALAMAVDHARYWQAADGEDFLTETPELKSALAPVAALVAGSSAATWWTTPAATDAQQSVLWDGTAPRPSLSPMQASNLPTGESGGWWSAPPRNVPVSTRPMFDGSPAGLWLVEDNLGWDRAESVNLTVPEGVRLFEIASAHDWVQLCTRFPGEVSESMRDAWHRATSHTGRWLAPNWGQVAQHYDAVHLQVGAYLAVAGRPIVLPGDPQVASMIAGWSPDETYWFTSRLTYGRERARWVLQSHNDESVWRQDTSTG